MLSVLPLKGEGMFHIETEVTLSSASLSHPPRTALLFAKGEFRRLPFESSLAPLPPSNLDTWAISPQSGEVDGRRYLRVGEILAYQTFGLLCWSQGAQQNWPNVWCFMSWRRLVLLIHIRFSRNPGCVRLDADMKLNPELNFIHCSKGSSRHLYM